MLLFFSFATFDIQIPWKHLNIKLFINAIKILYYEKNYF